MSDVFRKEYKPLSEKQKTQMADIKTEAENLLAQMDFAVDIGERSERGRCMNVARTHLETAIMWAVKAVTTTE